MEKLTLAGLARKLETLTEKVSGLEQENERIRTENTGLRERVAELTTTEKDNIADALAPEPASIFEGAMSRRSLFTKAGAAAVVATAAGMLLTPRKAKADETFTEGVRVITRNGGGKNDTKISFGNAAIRAEHDAKPGVRGVTNAAAFAGVQGQNNSTGGFGVYGVAKTGVFGESDRTSGKGVFGLGATGVEGESDRSSGFGVLGSGNTGVYGRSTRTGGRGVIGLGTTGVQGESTRVGGSGVFGRGATGYGGRFSGGLAQLFLNPASSSGSPTAGRHQRGEIYMDTNANIFVCFASGTPGSWVGLATYNPGGGD